MSGMGIWGRTAWLFMWAGILFCHGAQAIVAGDPAGTPADSAQARIVPNAAASPWSGVGRLETASGKSYTAAVIGPRHILTAAHAAMSAQAGDLGFNLYLNGNEPYRIKVDRVFVHPDYHGFKPGKDGFVHDDIAIVELSEMIPFGVMVYPVLLRPIPAGTPLIMIGYGVSGDGVRGVEKGSGMSYVRRAGGNVADSLLPDDEGDTVAEVFVFDFDGPGNVPNIMGGRTLGNGVEATLGEGDSGCPFFVRIRNQWFITGVGTFVTRFGNGPAEPGTFGTGGGGVLLSGYAKWIRATLPPEMAVSPLSFKEFATRKTHSRNPNAICGMENAACHPIPTFSYKKS
ncbi:MAG TPA: trypsin-like serine protease [Methylophilaceae bacterium]|nr:trypsin-like serine protease [Methylophilaceae bacterium]